MPLLPYDDVDEPASEPVTTPTSPQANAQVYVTGDTPTLITDVEGEPWTVEYYGNIIHSNEEPSPLDVDLDPTLQEYIHIMNFQLSVTDEPTPTTDGQTNDTVMEGAGIIYPETIKPNRFDMFVGRMATGFKAIFTIVDVDRASIYQRAAYKVTFRLWEQHTQLLQDNLDLKTTENRYFDRNRLLLGKPPIISYANANKTAFYSEAIRRCMEQLHNQFFSVALNTLHFNTGVSTVYDPFAVSFLNQIVNRRFLEMMPTPTEYNVGITDVLSKPTLWRAIMRSDGHGLDYLYPRHFRTMLPSQVTPAFVQSSIAHTTLDYVLLPDFWTGFINDVNETSYVLSHAFYDGEVESMTNLEKAVTMVLQRQRVSDALLNSLIDETPSKTDQDLFYHLILLSGLLTIRINEA